MQNTPLPVVSPFSHHTPLTYHPLKMDTRTQSGHGSPHDLGLAQGQEYFPLLTPQPHNSISPSCAPVKHANPAVADGISYQYGQPHHILTNFTPAMQAPLYDWDENALQPSLPPVSSLVPNHAPWHMASMQQGAEFAYRHQGNPISARSEPNPVSDYSVADQSDYSDGGDEGDEDGEEGEKRAVVNNGNDECDVDGEKPEKDVAEPIEKSTAVRTKKSLKNTIQFKKAMNRLRTFLQHDWV